MARTVDFRINRPEEEGEKQETADLRIDEKSGEQSWPTPVAEMEQEKPEPAQAEAKSVAPAKNRKTKPPVAPEETASPAPEDFGK